MSIIHERSLPEPLLITRAIMYLQGDDDALAGKQRRRVRKIYDRSKMLIMHLATFALEPVGMSRSLQERRK
jgi:hypothetical protein